MLSINNPDSESPKSPEKRFENIQNYSLFVSNLSCNFIHYMLSGQKLFYSN